MRTIIFSAAFGVCTGLLAGVLFVANLEPAERLIASLGVVLVALIIGVLAEVSKLASSGFSNSDSLSHSSTVVKGDESIFSLLEIFRNHVMHDDRLVHDATLREGFREIIFGLSESSDFTLRDFKDIPDAHVSDIELLKRFNSIMLENDETRANILSFIASIEEFSVGVLESRLAHHEAFSTYRTLFVDMIERHSVLLYTVRIVRNITFPYAATLYRLWKEEVGVIARTEREINANLQMSFKEMLM